jgi:hypothetical protein
MPHDPEEFLASIRSYFGERRWAHGEHVVIVATGVSADGAAVVLFREREGSPLLGIHVHVEEFATLFSPWLTSAQLGDIVAADEIADPGGPGVMLDVSWAHGLVADPDSVRWRISPRDSVTT